MGLVFFAFVWVNVYLTPGPTLFWAPLSVCREENIGFGGYKMEDCSLKIAKLAHSGYFELTSCLCHVWCIGGAEHKINSFLLIL